MMVVSIVHITKGIPHLSTFILLPGASIVMLDKDHLNLVAVCVASLCKLIQNSAVGLELRQSQVDGRKFYKVFK